jgi:hypothetical protein
VHPFSISISEDVTTIELPASVCRGSILEILSSAGITLVSVINRRSSLEDAFLSLVEGGDHK